ncbi:MAG TPA: GNAT family N-acetyltransferase [Vulgatibacter sp.]
MERQRSRIVRADDAEKRARDALTHQAWGQRLDLAQFEAREIRLRGHPWSRDAMETWLLVGEGGGVLASCETFRVSSRAAGAPGSTWAIASVFTEPALRGKGYAREMIEQVVDELHRHDASAQGVILFSEVGPTLYRGVGFVEVPWLERTLPASPGTVSAGVRLLAEEELEETFGRIPLPEDPFVAWPSAAQIDWHLERERIYAEILGRRRPVAAGATIGESTAIWAADFKNERLCMLAAHANDLEAGEALVRSAASIAAGANLRAVHVWESALLPLPPALGRIRHAEDVPMLRPLAGGIAAGDWRTIPRALWV